VKLTLFSLPKAFAGIYTVIQENALKSWAALQPKAQIVLFGNEAGCAEIAGKYGAHHDPHVRTNELNTPLVSHLFQTATALTSSPYQCFLNADIILDPVLPEVVDRAHAWKKHVLLVSRRWDLDLTQPIETDRPDWFSPVKQRVKAEGRLYTPLGMDVFVFPTGFFDHMPPFSVGWPGAKYDNWIIYAARQRGIPIIDVTDAMTTVHQNHPPGGASDPRKAREHWVSMDLLGGYGCCYDILDATHVMDEQGRITRQPWQWERAAKSVKRVVQRGRYRVRRKLFGFRYTQLS
jgi:hypothetical protein